MGYLTPKWQSLTRDKANMKKSAAEVDSDPFKKLEKITTYLPPSSSPSLLISVLSVFVKISTHSTRSLITLKAVLAFAYFSKIYDTTKEGNAFTVESIILPVVRFEQYSILAL